MTVKLELTPELQAGMLALAQGNGLSLEAFAAQVLRERAQSSLSPVSVSEPFWKAFMRHVHALPEHDHYLYGAPKSNG